MIKAKQHFFNFRWKIEFDSKTSGWVGQNLSPELTRD